MSDGERAADASTWRWTAVGVAVAGVQAAALHALTGTKLSAGGHGALLALAIVLPFVILAGAGVLRRPTLAVWVLAAAAVTAGLGAWAELRQAGDHALMGAGWLVEDFLALVIGQVLVEAADVERRLIASYPLYVAATRRLAVQTLLALVLFVGVLLLANLGASLCGLIGLSVDGGLDLSPIDAFAERSAVCLPVLTLCFALTIEPMARRPGLATQIGGVVLVLARRLLPLAVLLAGGFLVGLAARGFVLKSDVDAVGAALAMCLVLILMVNAAYRDGAVDVRLGLLVRWSARAAGFCIAGLWAVAAFGLWTGAQTQGLTPARVVELAWLAGLAVFALGYTLAAVRRGAWMHGVAATNLAAAGAILAILAALATPLADPGRIAAADQYRRLAQSPSDAWIDYFQLNFPAYGRFGRVALWRLSRLSAGPGSRETARQARLALDFANGASPRPEDLAPNIRVHPAGASLPEGFLARWAGVETPISPLTCTQNVCDAYLLDVDQDGQPEVLLGVGGQYAVFKRASDGGWQEVGQAEVTCDGDEAAMRAGRLRPVESPLRDLEVAGRRYGIRVDTSCDGSKASEDHAGLVLEFSVSGAPWPR